ncbi:hypothetical protein TanjilG_32812 [Lupinus angustifolius]|uniref:Uncharacterized protein n=1 Tax=Lupinus angustifolius TaxID=3871 RepID=A0A4P1RFJ3_LUPAN|nr:hypothetical protein TanjilG_32812 [Lupinus angustifolius]
MLMHLGAATFDPCALIKVRTKSTVSIAYVLAKLAFLSHSGIRLGLALLSQSGVLYGLALSRSGMLCGLALSRSGIDVWLVS